MIRVVDSIFKELGFTHENIMIDENNVTLHTKDSVAYAVVEAHPDNVLSLQSRIFSVIHGKKNSKTSSKDLNLLILHDNGKAALQNKKIIGIEENAFYFKKSVVTYSSKDSAQLEKISLKKSVLKYIVEFCSEKQNLDISTQNTVAIFLYSLLIKIPLIKFELGKNSFADLTEKISKKIEGDDDVKEIYGKLKSGIIDLSNLQEDEIVKFIKEV